MSYLALLQILSYSLSSYKVQMNDVEMACPYIFVIQYIYYQYIFILIEMLVFEDPPWKAHPPLGAERG